MLLYYTYKSIRLSLFALFSRDTILAPARFVLLHCHIDIFQANDLTGRIGFCKMENSLSLTQIRWQISTQRTRDSGKKKKIV